MRSLPEAKKRKVDLRGQEKRRNKVSNGMVCCCHHVPMHEMWKGQQVHEDARKMHKAEVPVMKFGKVVKSTCWEPRFGKKSGQTG